MIMSEIVRSIADIYSIAITYLFFSNYFPVRFGSTRKEHFRKLTVSDSISDFVHIINILVFVDPLVILCSNRLELF